MTKGRIYVQCPAHPKRSMQYGVKACLKRLYFKPGNKLKSIPTLWICEATGIVYRSNSKTRSWYGEKETETNLEKIGNIESWKDLFPEIFDEWEKRLFREY